MRISQYRISAIVPILLLLPCASVSQDPAAKFETRKHGPEAAAAKLDPAMLRRIDVTLQRYVADKDVAGVVALIARDGQIGYHEAFGLQSIADAKPMTKSVIFRIYSMTKPIVTLAALMLFEQGKLDLDEPISKRLPEWKNARILRETFDQSTGETIVRSVPAKNPITVRDLMRHSSGLYYGFDPESRKKLAKAGVYRQGITLAEFSKALAKAPLKFEPGTAYNYGYSLDILGRYIEVVSGQPLDVYLEENIFRPLKMKDTGFYVPNNKKDRFAVTYTKKKGKLVGLSNAGFLRKPSAPMGGGGLVSTSEDYLRFCQVLLNRGKYDGGRLAKAETIDRMFRNQLGKIYKRGRKTYGLGGAIDGKGNYSWGGMAGTKFFVDTKSETVVVFMIQRLGYRSRLYPAFRSLAVRAIRNETQTEQ